MITVLAVVFLVVAVFEACRWRAKQAYKQGVQDGVQSQKRYQEIVENWKAANERTQADLARLNRELVGTTRPEWIGKDDGIRRW